MEGGVDHAGLHALGDVGAQHGVTRAARHPRPVALLDAALFGVVGVDLQHVLGVPDEVGGAPGLRADVVLAEDAAGGQQQREALAGALIGGDIGGEHEAALATHERVDVHDRRAVGRFVVARPLDAAELVEAGVADALEGGREAGDLVHDCRRVGVVHRVAQGLRERDRDLPVRHAG